MNFVEAFLKRPKQHQFYTFLVKGLHFQQEPITIDYAEV